MAQGERAEATSKVPNPGCVPNSSVATIRSLPLLGLGFPKFILNEGALEGPHRGGGGGQETQCQLCPALPL